MCLLRTPLRWSGAALGLLACLWALAAPRPDVLMAADGQSAAIRGAGGRLLILASGRDTFAIKEWLAADGDPRKPGDTSLTEDVRCDAIGCTATLANGRLVAYAQSAGAFEEDCARAAAVLSPRDAPGACQASLIDRRVWRTQGATALFWNGDRFERAAGRPANVDRPWARAVRSQRTDAAEIAPVARRPSAPDATPPTDAVEADD
jgi:competence protein ComEC